MAKTISLFLLDDKANGRLKCSINGRSGIIFKIPRKDLSKSKDRSELKYDGIYFLLGEEDGREKIYVGQASSRKSGNGILGRLSEHDRNGDKNFWTEAIVFTTTDNSFGSTEISWPENKFCNMAIKAARCLVVNGNEPPPGNVSEEKKSELEEQVEFVLLILGAIGYKMFEPQKISPPPVVESSEEIFYLSRFVKRLGRKINAQMKRTPTGYKVLAGSEISPIEDGNRPLNVKNARHFAKIDNGRLLEDVEFSKPSPAAEFVLGTSAAGPISWKTRDGVPLQNFL